MIDFLRQLFGGKKSHHELILREVDTIKNNVKDSFNNIKDDMKKHKTWIDYLYNSHTEINKLHDNLKAHHENHERIHNKDVDNINGWISHLHENQKKHEENIKKLENSLRNAFTLYNKYLIDLYKIVHTLKDEKKEDVETLIDVDRRLDTSLPEPKEEKEEGPLLNMSKNLTRTQKAILAQLMNTEQKLSYKDIAMLMNISTSTVKNHICNMRNKGFPLVEYKDEGNIKRYYLPENMKKILVSKRF